MTLMLTATNLAYHLKNSRLKLDIVEKIAETVIVNRNGIEGDDMDDDVIRHLLRPCRLRVHRQPVRQTTITVRGGGGGDVIIVGGNTGATKSHRNIGENT